MPSSRTLLLPLAVLLVSTTTAPADDADGFTPLVNGKDTTGWSVVGGKEGTWKVEDGVLVTRGEGGGWIGTDKTYSNFILKLEFKVGPGGNSGVNIRAPKSGDPAYTGMEIQVLDDAADVYKNLQPYQYCGSVYGVIAAERGHTKPAGEWNSMEIKADGPHITVILNGATIVDGNLEDHPDSVKAHPGMKRTEGHIGFQSMHSSGDAPVCYRNVMIKELKK